MLQQRTVAGDQKLGVGKLPGQAGHCGKQDFDSLLRIQPAGHEHYGRTLRDSQAAPVGRQDAGRGKFDTVGNYPHLVWPDAFGFRACFDD